MKICLQKSRMRVVYYTNSDDDWMPPIYSLEYRVIYRKKFFGISFGKLVYRWRCVEYVFAEDYKNGKAYAALLNNRKAWKKEKQETRRQNKYPCEYL